MGNSQEDDITDGYCIKVSGGKPKVVKSMKVTLKPDPTKIAMYILGESGETIGFISEFNGDPSSAATKFIKDKFGVEPYEIVYTGKTYQSAVISLKFDIESYEQMINQSADKITAKIPPRAGEGD